MNHLARALALMALLAFTLYAMHREWNTLVALGGMLSSMMSITIMADSRSKSDESTEAAPRRV